MDVNDFPKKGKRQEEPFNPTESHHLRKQTHWYLYRWDYCLGSAEDYKTGSTVPAALQHTQAV